MGIYLKSKHHCWFLTTLISWWKTDMDRLSLIFHLLPILLFFHVGLWFGLCDVFATGTWVLSAWVGDWGWSQVDVFLRNILRELGVRVLGIDEGIFWLFFSILDSNNCCLKFFGYLIKFGFDLDFSQVILFQSSPSLLDLWS